MKSIIIAITFCLSVQPKPAQQCSIQPATQSISANQEGVFKCRFNNSNQPLPGVIIWLFNNSVVENFPITRQKFLSLTTSEDDVATITSTLTFVIDTTSASMFNNTAVECLALVINEDSTQDVIILTAKLYVYGLLVAPTDVRVNFTRSKIYTRWTNAYTHGDIEPTAYHVNITAKSVDPIQSPVLIPGNYIQCIFYEVCVMEESLAGIGHPACIQTSSNVSGTYLVMEAIEIHTSNVSVLNYTNTTSGVDEQFIVGCSGKAMQVHMQGEFHNATVSIKKSATSLELKLPASYIVTPSDAITLKLSLLQPRAEDLLDVQIENKGSTVQLQCVYAKNSLTDGCLIVIVCDGVSPAIFINSNGEQPVSILVNCTFSCVSGSLYGYANNYGVVADEPSVTESIDFDQCVSYLASVLASFISPTVTSGPGPIPASAPTVMFSRDYISASSAVETVIFSTAPGSAWSPSAQGSLLITLFVLMSLTYCLPWMQIFLVYY